LGLPGDVTPSVGAGPTVFTIQFLTMEHVPIETFDDTAILEGMTTGLAKLAKGGKWD